ncbi:MAG: septum formation family protein [Acidimicrobiales bacterium]
MGRTGVRPAVVVVAAVMALIDLGGCGSDGTGAGATTVVAAGTVNTVAPTTAPPTTVAPTTMPPTTRAPTTTAVADSDTSLPIRPNDIVVGDCIARAAMEMTVDEVLRVSCRRPHDQEAFHQFDVSGDEYPGAEAMTAVGLAECSEAFQQYVGIPVDASKYEMFSLSPTPESWEIGDRLFTCLLGVEQGITTGSARGTMQ